MRLLLVEDTADLAEAIVVSFRRRGDAIDHAVDHASATACLAASNYDVVILDLGLPDGDGISVLTGLRQHDATTPVLILTARLGIEDRVRSLDLGADDYLVKPFDIRELAARVRALARRAVVERQTCIEYGDLRVDPAGRTVTCGQRDIELSRREFSLLEALLANRGRVASKERLYSRLFTYDEQDVGTNAIELYVSRLRRKLDCSGVRIRTLRGLGYQLVATGDAPDP